MIMALKIQDSWILFAMKWDHMKNKRTLEKLENQKWVLEEMKKGSYSKSSRR